MRDQPPEIFNKLIPIAGDVGEDNLGISPADREVLTANVNVIIHSAATLDFHDPLRPTVNINLIGTQRVIKLAQQTRDLQSFVYVSSAYVNSFLVECDEILYKAPTDAENLINLVEKSTDEELEAKLSSLLGEHPNAYTFTKHLAEHEVHKAAGTFPCGIVRPSMSKFQRRISSSYNSIREENN